jgi:hypothetical protein
VASELIIKNKDKLEEYGLIINNLIRLAEYLLKNETIDLSEITEILGERPFKVKETLVEYLKEIKNYKKMETKTKEAEIEKVEDSTTEFPEEAMSVDNISESATEGEGTGNDKIEKDERIIDIKESEKQEEESTEAKKN